MYVFRLLVTLEVITFRHLAEKNNLLEGKAEGQGKTKAAQGRYSFFDPSIAMIN